MRNKSLFLILIAAVMVAGPLYAQDVDPRATFRAIKVYIDANPAPVDVTITCNTGLPLEQTQTLDPDNDVSFEPFVEFVVTDFESGTLDCEITESVPAGYEPVYVFAIDDVTFDSDDSCIFEDVEHGEVFTEDPLHNICAVVNVLQPSTVTVTKEWIDENPDFNPVNFAEATYFCDNLPGGIGGQIDAPGLGITLPSFGTEGNGSSFESGSLRFIGNPGVDSFETLGNWDGGTVCDVTEQLVEGGVETDDSDCQNIVLFPGDDAECTIVNTRLFEGIPTLSQYGLALLAMLMLGIGFVAFRRIA